MKTLGSFFSLSGVKLLLAGAMMAGMMMLPIAGSYAQGCTDYCTQGYVSFDPQSQSYVCFSIPSAAHQSKVCLSFVLQYKQGSSCPSDQWYNVAIYDQNGNYAAPQGCTSPLHYRFQLPNPPGAGECPTYEYQCCCLPAGNYYVRILDDNGNDISSCVTGTVKVCLYCNNQNCP